MLRRRSLASAFALVLVPLTLWGCGGDQPIVQTEPIEEARFEGEPVDTVIVPAAALAQARGSADDLTRDLASLVFATLEEEGPAAAVRICSEVAQERTARHASDGILVRRTSDRLRNPRNAPDPAEARELERLQARHTAGDLPTEVIRLVRQGDERWVHYLRPIRVAPGCLTCHGAPEQLAPEVQDILRERYPDDRAVGYSEGDLRGVVSVQVRVRDGQ